MTYQLYKVIHIIGFIILFTAMGAGVARALCQNSAAVLKKNISISHGLGLVILLVSGFGILAKLGIPFKGWVIAKLIIWLAFGALLGISTSKPNLAKPIWYLTIILGGLAGYLAIYKPF